MRVARAVTLAVLAGAATGCPDKGTQADPPSASPGATPQPGSASAPKGPRGGYHEKAGTVGHAVEIRVRFAGTAPTARWDIPPMVRPQCGDADKAGNEALSVSADGGLDDAVVWLDDIHEGEPLASATPPQGFQQDEKRCTFTPHVLAMPVGATLKLTNSDPANHAVRFELRAEEPDDEARNENDDFTRTLPAGAAFGLDVKPDWAGRYARVTCPIHLWMSAYVHFFEHPYFAVTKAGVARLERVPPGRYHLRVWHEGIGVTYASSIKFPPPVTARAEVAVDEGDAKVAFTMNADGKLAVAP